MIDLGKKAYDAYCKHTGDVSLISGDKPPAWEDLPPAIRAAWVAAAETVTDAVLEWSESGD